jgi:hypothetical protein
MACLEKGLGSRMHGSPGEVPIVASRDGVIALKSP